MNCAFVWTSKKKSLKDKIELKLFKKFWDILSCWLSAADGGAKKVRESKNLQEFILRGP